MQLSRFGTYNAVLPAKGPIVYPVQLDFRTVGQIEVDFTSEIQQEHIDFISGIIFDNRLNTGVLEVSMPVTGYSFGIAAGKQGQLPLLMTDAAKLTFTTPTDPALIVPVWVVNFPLYPNQF